MRRTLLVFAKDPAAGRVKTRLAAAIGPDAARRVYEALVTDTAETLRKGFRGEAVWWIDGGCLRIRELAGPGIAVKRQPEGDLGVRLTAAFAEAFAAGKGHAAAIGTDCPGLDAEALEGLFSALDGGVDAALIPAPDGGYAAIALARRCDEAFSGVAWSSPRTLSGTLERLRGAGFSAALLPPLPDLDDADDLEFFREALREGRLRAPRLREALGLLGLL